MLVNDIMDLSLDGIIAFLIAWAGYLILKREFNRRKKNEQDTGKETGSADPLPGLH